MSVAKISVQIAVAESATGELTGLLTQFIMKYRRKTGLNVNEVREVSSYDYQRQPLEPLVILDNNSTPEISNPEYHKPKGRSQNAIRRQQK